MVRNVVIKKMLKSSVFRILTVLNKIIPKDDSIVMLYSANKGIQFSLVPLKQYLLDNGYHKKYKIYCGIENMKYAEKDNRVIFIPRIKAYLMFMKTKHVFYTTGQIPIKPSKSQCVIHMRHGNTNFKTMGKLTRINNGDEFFFTYMAASSPVYKPIMAKEFECSPDNIAVVGDPIIDELLNSSENSYDFSNYSKMVLWVPTFRKSDYLGYDDSEQEELVPLVPETEYQNLNEMLKRNNIKLIIKLHPAQKDFGRLQRHFEYLDIYTHEEFLKEGFSLYPLMHQSDALIGDYSSASMQYLVLDKPQGFVIPDYDQYKEKRGFVFKNAKDYMAGHIITNIKELYCFLDAIAAGKDVYKEKRHKVLSMLYTFPDKNNCKRIIELSGMK